MQLSCSLSYKVHGGRLGDVEADAMAQQREKKATAAPPQNSLVDFWCLPSGKSSCALLNRTDSSEGWGGGVGAGGRYPWSPPEAEHRQGHWFYISQGLQTQHECSISPDTNGNRHSNEEPSQKWDTGYPTICLCYLHLCPPQPLGLPQYKVRLCGPRKWPPKRLVFSQGTPMAMNWKRPCHLTLGVLGSSTGSWNTTKQVTFSIST